MQTRSQEKNLIEHALGACGERTLCTSAGWGQFAVEAARRHPQVKVHCSFLDLYETEMTLAAHEALPENLTVRCEADFPEEEFDSVALPLSAQGNAELTRDRLQSAHLRLRAGGKLFATTDNPRDRWLHETIREFFPRAARTQLADGAYYEAIKSEPLRKIKSFDCEFAFRDEGRLLRIVSRPGVFSHRRIDPGARALLDSAQIEPGQRVLDMGCGAGAVSLAAASREEGVRVLAVDSNIRAIECVRRGAELNQLTESIQTLLDAQGRIEPAGGFDLCLANPPYYSKHRISQIFLDAAHRALRPEGQLTLVTKSPDWHLEQMSAMFADVTVEEVKGYYLCHALK